MDLDGDGVVGTAGSADVATDAADAAGDGAAGPSAEADLLLRSAGTYTIIGPPSKMQMLHKLHADHVSF